MRSPRRAKKKSATRKKSSKWTAQSPSAIGRKKRSTDRRRAAIAYLGLGSNLGDRRAHLESALRAISELAPLRKVSSLYRAEPVGFRRQPDFYNAVVEVAWRGSPRALLDAVRGVERRVGRTRTFVNGPREIDVDILDFGGRVRTRPDPVLPHPRLAGRRFALAPLAEINPAWKDPRTGRGIAELLDALPPSPRVRKLNSRIQRRPHLFKFLCASSWMAASSTR